MLHTTVQLLHILWHTDFRFLLSLDMYFIKDLKCNSIVPGIILMWTVSCYVAVNFKFCEVAFLFNLHYNNGILIYSIVNRFAPFVLLYTICVEMTVTALHFTCWMKTRMKYLNCSTRTTCCPEQMILSSRKTSLKYVYVHSYSCLHYTDCFWSRTELFILIFFFILCVENKERRCTRVSKVVRWKEIKRWGESLQRRPCHQKRFGPGGWNSSSLGSLLWTDCYCGCTH